MPEKHQGFSLFHYPMHSFGGPVYATTPGLWRISRSSRFSRKDIRIVFSRRTAASSQGAASYEGRVRALWQALRTRPFHQEEILPYRQ
jgi:hypothetical protein